MNKRDQLRAYKSELREIETQEILMNRTMNVITRRKNVLLTALDELGASNAILKEKKEALTKTEILELRSSIYNKGNASIKVK